MVMHVYFQINAQMETLKFNMALSLDAHWLSVAP